MSIICCRCLPCLPFPSFKEYRRIQKVLKSASSKVDEKINAQVFYETLLKHQKAFEYIGAIVPVFRGNFKERLDLEPIEREKEIVI